MQLVHRFNRLFAVAALAACAALLVACGGGSSGSGSANDLLKQTFNGAHNIKSGNISLSFVLNAQGSKQLKGPVNIQFQGPFQSLGKGKLPKFDFSINATAQGKSFSAGAISTGDTGFLKYNGSTYAVPASVFDQFRTGFEQAASKSTGSTKQSGFKRLGIDPLSWLKNPKVVGNETVAGTDTKHITAQVDVNKLLDDLNSLLGKAGSLGIPNTGTLPSSITPAQRDQIKKAVKGASFDVFTGASDHTLRKLAIALQIAPTALGSAAAGGVQSVQIAFTFQIANLNQSQTISAPSGAKPLSDLTSKLGSLGSALGGAGSAGGTSGSPTVPSGKKLQQYTQCLQSAGNDITKAQKCAALLTK